MRLALLLLALTACTASTDDTTGADTDVATDTDADTGETAETPTIWAGCYLEGSPDIQVLVTGVDGCVDVWVADDVVPDRAVSKETCTGVPGP